ncbi:MAG: phosphoribosyl-ATP diphosphatase [Candidatus Promineofilum sp.]|nr:phosphoribosyl-ATP diphosphatase [Promineifilum sp.]
MTDAIYELESTLLRRKQLSVPESYTARLLAAGEDEIIKKIGEEAVEVILAAKGQGDQRVIEESADLIFHLLVLLISRDLSWSDVEKELERRKVPRE